MLQRLLFHALFVAASSTRLESFHAGLRATHAGDATAALEHFRAAVDARGSLGADDVSLHLALGEALSRAGHASEATEHLQRALDLCEEYGLGGKVVGTVEYNLGVALEELGGETSRAEMLYRKAASQGIRPALFNLVCSHLGSQAHRRA